MKSFMQQRALFARASLQIANATTTPLERRAATRALERTLTINDFSNRRCDMEESLSRSDAKVDNAVWLRRAAWLAQSVAAISLLASGGQAYAGSLSNLPAVQPVMACSALVGLDLSKLSGVVGGSITITSATIVPASSSNPAEYCA